MEVLDFALEDKERKKETNKQTKKVRKKKNIKLKTHEQHGK